MNLYLENNIVDEINFMNCNSLDLFTHSIHFFFNHLISSETFISMMIFYSLHVDFYLQAKIIIHSCDRACRYYWLFYSS